MKAIKIVYWATTIFFAGIFLTTGTLYLIHSDVMVQKFEELHLPIYLLDLLGVAKVSGAVVLLIPGFLRLKEWVYAGFAFDLIGAFWSHYSVQGLAGAALLLIPLSIMTISYTSYHYLLKMGYLLIVKKSAKYRQ